MLKEIFTTDLEYLAIFSLVLILPKIIQRLKIPSGITALCIGIGISILDPALKNDQLFRFLSQIGITSLFLFAGLEVDYDELKEDRVYLSKYLVKFSAALVVITFLVMKGFDLSLQNSFILSLGIFTPSAGFILNSLHSFDISEDQEYWVRSKAISKEVLSIVFLFLALQGSDPKRLLISFSFFVGLFLILPFIFNLFFKFISPYAPNSEIPFLITLSLISGILSKELGAYYLIGAFIVGLVGSRFKRKIFKEGEEVLFRSLSGFFSVFLPFYFFKAGLGLSIENFTLKAAGIGAAIAIIFVPLRIFLINYSLKTFISEFRMNIYKISLSLMPTLVFGLVIANILLERNTVRPPIIYGLIVYTLLTSLLPTVFFLFNKKKALS